MIAHVTDSQVVGETQATLFTIIQAAPVDAAVIMTNSGVNTINYDWQEWVNGVWTDLGASGSDYNNTLQAGETVLINVMSSNPKVQLLGNASGSAFLEFAITRYFQRESGGPIPLLCL